VDLETADYPGTWVLGGITDHCGGSEEKISDVRAVTTDLLPFALTEGSVKETLNPEATGKVVFQGDERPSPRKKIIPLNPTNRQVGLASDRQQMKVWTALVLLDY